MSSGSNMFRIGPRPNLGAVRAAHRRLIESRTAGSTGLLNAGESTYNDPVRCRIRMMIGRLLRGVLPSVIALSAGFPLAHADIYTWVDESGTVNVSNLTPPEGVQATKIVREIPRTAVPPPPVAVASTAPSQEVQFLADRVRQLEYEVELARRQAPPAIEYVPMPMPPAMQYGPDVAPQPGIGCDSSWNGCWNGLGFGAYPVGVVVLGAPNFRRPAPSRGGHRFAMQPTMHTPGRPKGR
jgi:Domain of unknown function (DUF4124)